MKNSTGSNAGAGHGAGGPRRRDFLKTSAAAAVVAAAPIVFTTRKSAEAVETLRILSWPGYDEPEVREPFEKQYGAKVEHKIYIGDEQMLQFFSQAPKGTFDLVVLDAEYVKKMQKLGNVQPLDANDYPFGDYTSKYQRFRHHWIDDTLYAVTVRFGFYGVGLNTKYVDPKAAETWEILQDPQFKGKVAIFDWYLPNMGNASCAVNYPIEAPYQINDQQLEKVRQWLLRLKPNVGAATPNFSDLMSAFVTESLLLGPVGDWLIITLIVEGQTQLKNVIPKEGAICWTEGLSVVTDSKNPDLAKKYIQYLSSPEAAARLAWVKAYKAQVPNLKAVEYMSEQAKELLGYVPVGGDTGRLVMEETLDNYIRFRELPENQPEKVWQDIWNEFRTAG